MNPFKITEPTVISFSGGRTSGYLLKRCIDENNGLPDDCFVIFENTGKEYEETLRFINDCAINFGVNIIWLEFDDNEAGYKVVNYETASRNGEPFEKVIAKGLMPNPSVRICTIEMKARTMSKYLRDLGYDEIVNFVGIRFDEPRRWDNSDGIQYEKKDGEIQYFKKSGLPKPVNRIISEEKYAPLRYAKITKADVLNFWDNNSFNLAIDSDYSNCDLCYLKGATQILQSMRENPKVGEWWASMEEKYGNRFRNDRPSYRQMMIIATDQPGFDFGTDDRKLPCACTD